MDKKAILKLMPERIRLNIIGLYLARKRQNTASLGTPAALTFFVTRRCNLKCGHCFYWKEIGDEKRKELTVPEIEKIASTIKKRFSLALTGGEPFLRQDLPDICSVFLKKDLAGEIGIATNGYLTEKIASDLRQILEMSRIPVSVQVSLDGCEITHDWIRGIPGSFRKACRTLEVLKELRRDFPERLKLFIAFSIQQKNIEETEEFIDLVLPLQIPVRFLITRGESFGLFNMPVCLSSQIEPRNKESAEISLPDLEKVFKMIAEKNRDSIFKFWEAKQPEIIALSLKILKEKKKQLPCYAGTVEGVLYDNGDLAFCEFMQPVGNLRKWQYDFHRLWHSPEADELRKVVTRCFCIHSCALGTSLHFHSPAMVDKAIYNDGPARKVK